MERIAKQQKDISAKFNVTMLTVERSTLTAEDTKCLRFLYYISSFLGLTPPFNFEKQVIYCPLSFKIHAVIFSLLIIFLHFREVYFQYVYVLPVINTPAFLLEFVLNNIKTLMVTMSMMQAAFWKRNDWVYFLNAIYETKSFCQRRVMWRMVLFMEIAVGHFVTWSFIFYDGYLWVKYFGIFYTYYTAARLQYYFILILVLFICNFALLIKFHAQHLNKRLDVEGCIYKQTIECASEEFTKLAHLVELFNSIFGCKIFLLLGVALVGFLEAVNFIFMYALDAENSTCANNYFSYEVAILSCMQGLLLLYWILFVIIRCDYANKELEKISKLCYQLLRVLPQEKDKKYVLLYLAQESSSRCPQITAGNVVAVKIGVFFGLVGSLTSYVIVLIQFSTTVAYKCPENITSSTYYKNVPYDL